MEEKTVFDLDGFDQVWRRVNGGAPSLPPLPQSTGAESLRSFIERAAEAAAFYTALAARSGSAARPLHRLAGAERSLHLLSVSERVHLRRLQVEYFLQVGDTCAPSRSCPMRGSVLGDLRKAYLGELANAERYRRAAQAAETAELAALYAELSEAETAHAAALRTLIAAALA